MYVTVYMFAVTRLDLIQMKNTFDERWVEEEKEEDDGDDDDRQGAKEAE